MKEKKSNDKLALMTEAPVERLICRMAVPTIISMLISALYNMADTFFVSRIGTEATAAVGVVFSVMTIIQAIGFFFGHGSGNYMSKQLGAQHKEEAARMAATGFFSAFFSGCVIAGLGLVWLEPLARLLGATETILPYVCDYLRYILIGMPFISSAYTLNNQLRHQGSAFYAMIGITFGAVLNVFLDPLLIFVFDMGVAGAAVATMASQMVSCAMLLAGTYMKGNIPVSIRNFSFHPKYFREILKGGTPSLCRQGIASISVIFLNRMAGGFGEAAIAAIAVVSRIAQFASSALIGFGQGFQPVCGFNYGAKRYDRILQGYWFCVKSSTAVTTILAALGFAFAPQVISIFENGDASMMEIGVWALRLQSLSFPLMGWVILANMVLQNIGKPVRASILAAGRQGLCFVPALYILVPRLGLLGLQLTQPVADVLTFAISIPLVVGVLKEMKQEYERMQATE